MKIGIIGMGNIGGMYAKRLSCVHDVIAYDADNEKLKNICLANGYIQASSLEDINHQAEIILLAVKPNGVKSVLRELQGKGKIFISTVAAVDQQNYYDVAGQITLFRIMPSMVNKTGGPIMVVRGTYAGDEEEQKVLELLQLVGHPYLIDEREMDAYMCVMSCSPAVFAEFFKQYVESFCSNSNIESEKALNTVLDMVEQLVPILRTERYDIIRQVCTPGGITEVGVQHLSNNREFFQEMADNMLFRTQVISASVREQQ
ncbi:MAG: NAD(P)-binding domain-containing protein [Negativicutes bacterium]|jgi:pyrroline-5-carboxylate reductase